MKLQHGHVYGRQEKTKTLQMKASGIHVATFMHQKETELQ